MHLSVWSTKQDTNRPESLENECARSAVLLKSVDGAAADKLLNRTNEVFSPPSWEEHTAQTIEQMNINVVKETNKRGGKWQPNSAKIRAYNIPRNQGYREA